MSTALQGVLNMFDEVFGTVKGVAAKIHVETTSVPQFHTVLREKELE